jgi:hypothetical protein
MFWTFKCMTLAELREEYGDEYPNAIIEDGVRAPLRRESRFLRTYESDDQNTGWWISRFMDGSASMTASELQQEWAAWAEGLQEDFCHSCGWLHRQTDFPEMLRFITEHGESGHLSAIALLVASNLPLEEAFEKLTDALSYTRPGPVANIIQAIAKTKHPHAEATLRRRLEAFWADPALWDNADENDTNWIAFSTTVCIENLIELGAAPSDFEAQVRRLSEHVCPENRRNCRDYLSEHYSWLRRG